MTSIAALLLAGCGSSVQPGQRSATLVATLGDSITAGSPGFDPDPRMRDTLGFGANEKSQWQYWAQRAHPGLQFRNCGLYGERTDEIAARLAACAQGAQVLIVQGGINDIAQGRRLEPAAANLRRMVERGKHLGLRVAIAELLPWNNGYPDADPKIRRLNELIRALARAENIPVLPFYETLEDPDRPGRMREEWTSDGDHPSVDGYRLLGEHAFRLPRPPVPNATGSGAASAASSATRPARAGGRPPAPAARNPCGRAAGPNGCLPGRAARGRSSRRAARRKAGTCRWRASGSARAGAPTSAAGRSLLRRRRLRALDA